MLYILYGNINYLINKEIQDIITQNNIDNLNISKYNLENSSLNHIINDASSMSLFSEKKLIIVDNAYIFTASTNKNVEQNIDELEKYLNNLNENTILLFIVNNDKLDERKKITKLAKKVGCIKDFNTSDTVTTVKGFLNDYSMSNDLIKYLVDRVGDDLTLLFNEINKIKTYKDTDKNITKDDIDLLTSKSFEENNFKLIDFIIKKNKIKAIELYEERLKLNEEPIAIIVSLANQIRILFQVKQLYLLGHTEKDITSILSIHPYRVKLALQNIKTYDLNELLRILDQLADLDYNIKIGNTNKEIGLELFILNM